MEGHCGLVNTDAACTCARRVSPAIKTGRIDPHRLLFATATDSAIGQMENLHATAAVFRSHPRASTPPRVIDAVRTVLASGKYPLLAAVNRPVDGSGHRREGSS
jgi:hypothetical protein